MEGVFFNIDEFNIPGMLDYIFLFLHDLPLSPLLEEVVLEAFSL